MEIYNNTLIKLIVRQGTDLDRKNIVFSSGEPAFTTDTYRLYMGTGNLSGGIPVSNITLGSTTDLTTLNPGIVGDIAYNSDTSSLFWITANDGSNIGDWSKIAGVYSGTGYININSSNLITLNQLSANSASSDFVKGPIILDSGRIALSATIPHQHVSTKTILITGGLVSTANGVNSTGIAINSLSSDITIQSNHIYARYNGTIGTLLYSKNITSSASLSTGHYRFTFGPLANDYYIPLVQIIGLSSLNYAPRVIAMSLSTCDVIVTTTGGSRRAADIVLSINY